MLDCIDHAKILISLFVILDLIGTVPLFMAVTDKQSKASRHAWRATPRSQSLSS